QATGAPVLMHADDFDLYRHLDVQASFLGMAAPPVTQIDEPLREGGTVHWGRFSAGVLHTPGHTPGSVSLYLPEDDRPEAGVHPGRLLAGDTLFAGSIGRTDLWGGSMEKILHSIRYKLL